MSLGVANQKKARSQNLNRYVATACKSGLDAARAGNEKADIAKESKDLRYPKLLRTWNRCPNDEPINTISSLEDAGLIFQHNVSTEINAVFILDRNLFKKTFFSELSEIFGDRYKELPLDHKDVIS